MSSIASSLSLIQQNIIRYVFPIILVLGNIGNLMCIIIFLQKHHRKNGGSLYLLAAATFSLLGVNWGLGTNMDALYRPPDVFTLSVVLCRIRGYILQVSAVLYRSMIVLACASRVASSSARPAMRTFTKPKTTVKIIGTAIFFWCIVSIHLPIFQEIRSGRCYVFGTYGVFFSIYQICILGVILPGIMIICSIFIWKNLKTTRIRIRPQEDRNSAPHQILTARDLNFIKLLFIEVISGVLLTISYPIVLLYNILAANVSNKSADRIQIEAFMSFISLILLFYLNYSVTFYIYTIGSKAFRKDVKQFVFKVLNRPEQVEAHITTIISNTTK